MSNEEKNLVDFITNSMFSVDFLRYLSDCIFLTADCSKYSVVELYKRWNTKNRPGQEHIPYNPGVLISMFYMTIVLAKERWFDLLPDAELSKSDPKFGLINGVYNAPQKTKPTLKYVARRIRNSLAHGNMQYNIPPDTNRINMHDKILIIFNDLNPRNKSDTFEGKVKLGDIIKFGKEFHHIYYDHVKNLP